LEEVDENRGETETESNEVHDVDTDTVGTVFAHDFGVEEKQWVLYGPVAEEVEDVGGHDELGLC
jgi:hypothetical protein